MLSVSKFVFLLVMTLGAAQTATAADLSKIVLSPADYCSDPQNVNKLCSDNGNLGICYHGLLDQTAKGHGTGGSCEIPVACSQVTVGKTCIVNDVSSGGLILRRGECEQLEEDGAYTCIWH